MFDVVQSPDGSLVAAGIRNNRVYVIKVNFEGKLQWERDIGVVPRSAQSVVVLPGEEIVLTGHAGKKNNETCFLMKISPDGQQVLWEKSFLKDWASALEEKKIPLKFFYFIRANDLILTKEGGFAITGTAETSDKKEDMFFLKTDAVGNLLYFELYGGRREDASKAIVQTWDNQYMMAGYNLSDDGRGERRSQAWLNLIEPNGKRVWDEKEGLFGDALNDEANSVVQMSDGSVLIGGYSSSRVLKDAYLIRLEKSPPPSTSGKPAIKTYQTLFHDANSNAILEPTERGYISFNLTNDGDGDAYGLTAELNAISFAEGVEIPHHISIGYLAKQSSRKISIPVVATETLQSGISRFEVRFPETNGTSIESFTFEVESRKEAIPRLEIVQYRFIRDELQKNRRTDTITLEIELKNNGDAPAEDVFFKFSLPEQVKPIDKLLNPLETMPPGSSKKVSLRFRANSLFQQDTLQIESRAWEKTRRNGTVGRHNIVLPSFDDAEAQPEKIPRKTGRQPGLTHPGTASKTR
ncbi:MAG: hypothetical protein IPM82_20680 [Saprospiraceae bacterium]|nr:hypothetical protein [Saprospiraceae bacterium]